MKRILFALVMLVGLMFGAVEQAEAEPLVAYTTTNRLITFDSTAPGTLTNNVAITGLQSGESLRGIDYRPANGLLYGLTNQSRLYVINPMTGVAVFASQLSTPLSNPGGFFGVDFNPTNDRLRIVGSNDQNLSVNNVGTGATTAETPINPAAANIVGSAYTNNFVGAATTTLYGINVADDTLVIQNPPASGTVTTVGSLGLTFEAGSFVGFDISGQTGIAYAVFSPIFTSNAGLYTINLATGQATFVGLIGNGTFQIEGLAAPVGGGQPSAVPEPATMILLGTGLAGIAAKVRRRKKDSTD